MTKIINHDFDVSRLESTTVNSAAELVTTVNNFLSTTGMSVSGSVLYSCCDNNDIRQDLNPSLESWALKISETSIGVSGFVGTLTPEPNELFVFNQSSYTGGTTSLTGTLATTAVGTGGTPILGRQGEADGGVQFDASNYLTSPENSSQLSFLLSNEFTIAFSVKKYAAGFVFQHGITTPAVTIEHQGSDHMIAKIYNDSGTSFIATDTGGTLPAGDHLYFVTFDGVNLKIYFDNSNVGTSATFTGLVRTPVGVSKYGETGDAGQYHIAFFDKAFSSEERADYFAEWQSFNDQPHTVSDLSHPEAIKDTSDLLYPGTVKVVTDGTVSKEASFANIVFTDSNLVHHNFWSGIPFLKHVKDNMKMSGIVPPKLQYFANGSAINTGSETFSDLSSDNGGSFATSDVGFGQSFRSGGFTQNFQGSINSSDAVAPTTGNWTISFREIHTVTPDNSHILLVRDSSVGHIRIYFDTTGGNLVFLFRNNVSAEQSLSIPIPSNGVWRHHHIVYNSYSDIIEVFEDNVSVGTILSFPGLEGGLASPSIELFRGSPFSGSSFTGNIDVLRFHSRKLSSNERLAEINGEQGIVSLLSASSMGVKLPKNSAGDYFYPALYDPNGGVTSSPNALIKSPSYDIEIAEIIEVHNVNLISGTAEVVFDTIVGNHGAGSLIDINPQPVSLFRGSKGLIIEDNIESIDLRSENLASDKDDNDVSVILEDLYASTSKSEKRIVLPGLRVCSSDFDNEQPISIVKQPTRDQLREWETVKVKSPADDLSIAENFVTNLWDMGIYPGIDLKGSNNFSFGGFTGTTFGIDGPYTYGPLSANNKIAMSRTNAVKLSATSETFGVPQNSTGISFGIWTNRGALSSGVFPCGFGEVIFGIGLGSTGNVYIDSVNIGNVANTPNGTIPENEWHHVAITWDTAGTGDLKLYIDGLVRSTANDPGTFSVSGNFFVVRTAPSAQTVRVAKPFVHSGVLTSTQIMDLATDGINTTLAIPKTNYP